MGEKKKSAAETVGNAHEACVWCLFSFYFAWQGFRVFIHSYFLPQPDHCNGPSFMGARGVFRDLRFDILFPQKSNFFY